MIKKLYSKFKAQEEELKIAIFYFFIWKITTLLFILIATIKIAGGYSDLWVRWDQSYYILIAKTLYNKTPGIQNQFAFPPLLPLLIRGANFIFTNYIISGQIISTLALLLAVIYFYKLIRIDFSPRIALRSIVYILIFPFSIFFGFIYTESLFLFLATSSFYYARKQRWLLSSILAGLASATRVMGIFIFFGILYEYLHSKHWDIKKMGKELIYILLLSPAGLFFYMVYCQIKIGDFLAFFHAQSDWGKTINFNIFVPIRRSLYPIEHLFFLNMDKEAYLNNFIEVMSLVGGLVLLFLAIKKVRASYLIYSFLSLSLSVLTANFVSVNRYVIIIFPIFMLLAIWGEKKYIDEMFRLVFLIFFGLYLTLFIMGGIWVG